VPCHFQRSGASPHCPLYRRQSSSSPCLTLHYSETSSSASLKCDRLSCPRSILLACPPHARMLIPFPRTPRHTLATSLWNSSLSSDRQHPMLPKSASSAGDADRDALKAESAGGSCCSSPSGGAVSLGWEPIKTPSSPLSPDSTSVIVFSILTPLASPFPSLSHLALVLRWTTSPSARNQFPFIRSVTPSSPSPLPRLLKQLFIDRMMHVHSFPFRLLGEIMVGGGISFSSRSHMTAPGQQHPQWTRFWPDDTNTCTRPVRGFDRSCSCDTLLVKAPGLIGSIKCDNDTLTKVRPCYGFLTAS